MHSGTTVELEGLDSSVWAAEPQTPQQWAVGTLARAHPRGHQGEGCLVPTHTQPVPHPRRVREAPHLCPVASGPHSRLLLSPLTGALRDRADGRRAVRVVVQGAVPGRADGAALGAPCLAAAGPSPAVLTSGRWA